jgi:hypothetical protein
MIVVDRETNKTLKTGEELVRLCQEKTERMKK